MSSFTFSKAAQWARLEPPGLIFDTLGLEAMHTV